MSITKISPSVVDFDAGITISTADNTTQLTLKSTDADANTGPVLNLQRDSGSPADNDYIGNIKLQADNDAGEVLDHVSILGQIVDASDGTEDAKLTTYVLTAGTVRNALEINPTEVVINEDSIDRDFRVESDVNTHSLFVDGETGKVALGTSTIGNGQLIINTADENHIRLENGSELGQIYLEDGGDVVVLAHGASQNIKFLNGTGTGTERVRIGDNGILFNGDSAAANALDDYEEGTWIPSITAGGWSIDSTVSATYTKIGRVVHVHVYTSITGTGNSDDFTMSGLPFNSASNHYAVSKIDAEKVNTHGAYARSQPGTANFIFLTSEESTSSGRTVLDGNEFGAGYIILSMTYFV
tara:strand:+ start:1351 stop:2418 length:1068 start_codon:yes stop_codon:yes gene_type:complete